jgi:lactoylglutathione lyase
MALSAIVYVDDVAASLTFYEGVLDTERHHLDEDGSYGEIEYGETRIGFAASWHARRNLDIPFRRNDRSDEPGAFELYFVVEEVDGAFNRALEAGGSAASHPADKPWGRTAIVRDPDGVLVELAAEG